MWCAPMIFELYNTPSWVVVQMPSAFCRAFGMHSCLTARGLSHKWCLGTVSATNTSSMRLRTVSIVIPVVLSKIYVANSNGHFHFEIEHIAGESVAVAPLADLQFQSGLISPHPTEPTPSPSYPQQLQVSCPIVCACMHVRVPDSNLRWRPKLTFIACIADKDSGMLWSCVIAWFGCCV